MGYRLLAILALLTGCGIEVEYVGAGPDGWEADLRDIAMEFAADAAEYNLPPSKLGRLHVLRRDDRRVEEAEIPDGHFIGICIIQSAKRGRRFRGEIYIKSGIEGDMLRRLVYHELTHCVYEQDHFGEEGDIQWPRLSTLIPWEEAKHRHFRALKEGLVR